MQYDKAKIEKDLTKKLDFIDLCKYPTSGYSFACGKISGEEAGIRKYFIKDKSIEQAYKIFENHNLAFPKDTNLYDYSKAYSNKDDGVGSYYIWDNERRLWVINMGYDSGSIEIYTQTDKYVEVIYQWGVDW